MTKNKTLIVLIVLTVISVIVSFWLYRKVDYLNNRLETLGDNVIYYCDSIDQVKFQIHEFKEQAYIRQQERDTSLILTVFAVLFATFVALNLVVSEARLTSFKNKISKQTTKKASKWDKKHNRTTKNLLNIKADLDREVSSIEYERALKAYNDKDYDDFVTRTLFSIDSLADYYVYYHNSGNDNLAKKSLELIIDRVNYVNSNILDKEYKSTIDRESVARICNNVRRLHNTTLDQALSLLQVSIKYPV